MTLKIAAGIAVVCAMASSADAQAVSGEAVYQAHCASCHDTTAPRVPPKSALQKIAAANILRELESGAMFPMARDLQPAERQAVAAYLGVAANGAATAADSFCSQRAVTIPNSPQPMWNGWSPSASNTRFQPAGAAGLTVERTRNLKLKWAFGFEGDNIVFSLPTVIGNNIFVGSASGKVHALDTQTGCTRWMFQADAGVRSAIVMVPAGSAHALLFGDRGGWFYSVEAETGRLLWKKKVDDHEAARITGAAVVNDGIAYIPVASVEETSARRANYICCTFRGSVVALRIQDGSQVWKTFMIAEEARKSGTDSTGAEVRGPSGVAVWSTPTIDLKRGMLYVGTGNNYSDPASEMSDSVVALEMKTGRIAWHRQTLAGDILNGNCQVKNDCPGPDYDFGSSAILERVPNGGANGRDLVLAGQKSGVVYALDPDAKGRIVWQVRVGKGGVNGGVQWGMASDGKNVYAATSDVVRRGAAGYDPAQGGGLTALRISDGAKVWYAAPPACDAKKGCSPAQSAAVTAIPGVVFAGSLDGHVRGYSAEDGKVLWDFDTAREFQTVNGVKASGGGVDGPGPVVVNHMLLVGSGYARTGGMGGNVLLAFSAE
ncbi:MAG TPA: PQQ-binding-like beta-propeller repeat protein [Bryobacteraceae bacterium]|nr:PQQ-binding-like beta-propeller repeat protein [Bryobacteraceae bacterium]